MTTDESARPVTSAEAGEVESNPEDQIPGQESLFPGLHGDDEGAAHLLSPPSGKPLIAVEQPRPDEAIKALREKLLDKPPMALEKEPGQREYLILPENSGERIGNPLMRRPSPYSPKRLFGDDEPGAARGAVPLASMREPGFLDQQNAEEDSTKISDRLLADPEKEDNERVNLLQNRDGLLEEIPASAFLPDEENFFRIIKADEPNRGDETGMPVVGFKFTALLPDGSIIEGELRAPCGHENYTPHGRLKNTDLLAEITALSLQQFLDELAKLKALAEAAYRAQNAYCAK